MCSVLYAKRAIFNAQGKDQSVGNRPLPAHPRSERTTRRNSVRSPLAFCYQGCAFLAPAVRHGDRGKAHAGDTGTPGGAPALCYWSALGFRNASPPDASVLAAQRCCAREQGQAAVQGRGGRIFVLMPGGKESKSLRHREQSLFKGQSRPQRSFCDCCPPSYQPHGATKPNR